MTNEQKESIKVLSERNPDGSGSLQEFEDRFKGGILSDYVGAVWCRMFVGIEKDGHRHS